jgi:hypothetical protein
MNDAPTTLRERVISAISFGSVWDREHAIAPVGEIFDDIVSALKRDVRFKHITRDFLQERGFAAERVPLSGAARFCAATQLRSRNSCSSRNQSRSRPAKH